MGWYVADPGLECFKVGVVPGAYGTLTVAESLSLVKGVDYVFVLDVDGDVDVDGNSNSNGEQPQASGSYNITSTDILFASKDTLGNKDVTRFTTPF